MVGGTRQTAGFSYDIYHVIYGVLKRGGGGEYLKIEHDTNLRKKSMAPFCFQFSTNTKTTSVLPPYAMDEWSQHLERCRSALDNSGYDKRHPRGVLSARTSS